MTLDQLPLPLTFVEEVRSGNYRERLTNLLTEDLDFHGQDSGYASHNFHSFLAKFPPLLPQSVTV